jgi:23S rRNA pseudouridine2605 synthase
MQRKKNFFTDMKKKKPTASVQKGKFMAEKPQLIKRKPKPKDAPVEKVEIEKEDLFEDMRLNKYIAHCGVCSRRKAAEMIEKGYVSVNNVIVKEIGHKIVKGDLVTYNGKIVKPIEKMVYVLMNKPRGVITTVNDEKDRKTVMHVLGDFEERIYPVGRLDRDTCGLLLLTNDGDLAQKLSHPSHMVKKIYIATLDKPLIARHLEKIEKGVELEDGVALVDSISYLEPDSKKDVVIEIHIGKNRVVRRIFESLGYEVTKLDRTYYGGLTKKDLPRGRFRYLTEREVIMLKHFTNRKAKQ